MTTQQMPWQLFRGRVAAVEAFRWWGEPVDGFERTLVAAPDGELPSHHTLIVSTRDSIMYAAEGDWIVRGVDGKVYPCKDDLFRMTYDLAGSSDA